MDEQHLHEKQLDDELIYDGRLIKLHLQTIQLPDGETGKREVIQHPGAVAVVPMPDREHVILIRQFRKAIDQVMWEIPAGTLEAGEELLFAAGRELREEIGYKPNSLIKLGGIHVAPGYSSEYIHIYLADDLSQEKVDGDVDEFIDIHTITFDDALNLLHSGQITDAKTITGLLLTKVYLANQT